MISFAYFVTGVFYSCSAVLISVVRAFSSPVGYFGGVMISFLNKGVNDCIFISDGAPAESLFLRYTFPFCPPLGIVIFEISCLTFSLIALIFEFFYCYINIYYRYSNIFAIL